jgi:hypothetical protein
MKYYVELNVEEHYLNPYEIACKYRIVSKTGQAHNRFVARLLTEYCKKMNIEDKIYYQTKQGMMRVYPEAVYKPLMDKLIMDHPKDTEITMEFENKNHYFIIKEETSYIV